MSIKHFEISNKVYLEDNFKEVISLILEHGSGVFDDAQFVEGSDTSHKPMSSYTSSQHEARLTLYKNENINFFFKYWVYNTANSVANKRRILNLYHVDKTGTEIFTTDVDTNEIESQTMGYMYLNRDNEISGTFGKAGTGNMIDGITFINNNAIAIDFNNIHFYNNSNPQQAKFLQSKGIIIFALTNKNNVALITPSYVDRGNIYSYNNKNSNDIPQGYNYLKVLCRSSYYSKLKYDNIPWKPVYGSKTILNPIIVNNSDEYVPDVYYTPVTQYIIDPHDDAILDINGDLYYYNGFIAVKVNS